MNYTYKYVSYLDCISHVIYKINFPNTLTEATDFSNTLTEVMINMTQEKWFKRFCYWLKSESYHIFCHWIDHTIYKDMTVWMGTTPITVGLIKYLTSHISEIKL